MQGANWEAGQESRRHCRIVCWIAPFLAICFCLLYICSVSLCSVLSFYASLSFLLSLSLFLSLSLSFPSFFLSALSLSARSLTLFLSTLSHTFSLLSLTVSLYSPSFPHIYISLCPQLCSGATDLPKQRATEAEDSETRLGKKIVRVAADIIDLNSTNVSWDGNAMFGYSLVATLLGHGLEDSQR